MLSWHFFLCQALLVFNYHLVVICKKCYYIPTSHTLGYRGWMSWSGLHSSCLEKAKGWIQVLWLHSQCYCPPQSLGYLFSINIGGITWQKQGACCSRDIALSFTWYHESVLFYLKLCLVYKVAAQKYCHRLKKKKKFVFCITLRGIFLRLRLYHVTPLVKLF